jgi:hypothetical protein
MFSKHCLVAFHYEWVVMSGDEQSEHHTKKEDCEDQDLVNERALIVQMHEYQDHQAAFERCHSQSDGHVHALAAEVHERKTNSDRSENQQRRTYDEVGLNVFGDFAR